MTEEPIKLYPNEKIAGTSDNVSRVTITQEFAFEDFVIVVEGVPAYRDNETGTQYVPGGVAMFISDAVMEEARKIRQEIAQRKEPLREPIRRQLGAWSGLELSP